jgi:DNA (cytosine-5)-methyltransferase 1
MAEEIHQNQEEEEEVVAASTAKRRRMAASSGKKPKQAKPAVAGMKKKGETERMEPVVDDVCAEEPDEEELAMGEEEAEAEAEAEEQAMQEVVAAVAAGSPGKKRVGRRSAAASGDHVPEFIGSPVAAAEAHSNWPKRYERSTAANKYIVPPFLPWFSMTMTGFLLPVRCLRAEQFAIC